MTAAEFVPCRCGSAAKLGALMMVISGSDSALESVDGINKLRQNKLCHARSVIKQAFEMSDLHRPDNRARTIFFRPATL